MTTLNTTVNSNGRHRAPTSKDIAKGAARLAATVPADVYDALRRAVEVVDGIYEPADWSFRSSSVLGWVATRESASVSPFSVLAISEACRTRWVKDGHTLDEVFAGLSASTPLGRAQIEFLLFENARFFRGQWHLRPVADLGWVCSRETRLRGRIHFAVARNSATARLAAGDVAEATRVLTRMLADG